MKQFKLLNRVVYTEDIITSEDFRNYNFDLNPKFIYSKSKSTEELSSSNASNYLEFSSVKNIIFYYQGKLMNVPFSKSEIFTSTDLELLEKQKLLAFLYSIMKIKNKDVDVNSTTDIQKDYELDDGILSLVQSNLSEQSSVFLKKNFSDKIQSMITLILANTDPNCQSTLMTVDELITKIHKFLLSLQIYGNTPFLYPSYGSSEFTQALCRLGAVYGAIFLVNEAFKIHVEVNKDFIKGGYKYNIHFNDEENKQQFDLKVKNVVINEIYLSDLGSSIQLSSELLVKKNIESNKYKLLKYICFVSIKHITELRKNNNGVVYFKIMKNDPVLNNAYGFTTIEYFHNSNSAPLNRSLLQIYINNDDEDVKEEIFIETCKGIIEGFIKRRIDEIKKEIKDNYDLNKENNEFENKLRNIEIIEKHNVESKSEEKSIKEDNSVEPNDDSNNNKNENQKDNRKTQMEEKEKKDDEDVIQFNKQKKEKKEKISLIPEIILQYEFIQVVSNRNVDIIQSENKSNTIHITQNDYINIDLDYYYIECESLVKSAIGNEAIEITKEEERINKSNVSEDTDLINELFNSISLTNTQKKEEFKMKEEN